MAYTQSAFSIHLVPLLIGYLLLAHLLNFAIKNSSEGYQLVTNFYFLLELIITNRLAKFFQSLSSFGQSLQLTIQIFFYQFMPFSRMIIINFKINIYLGKNCIILNEYLN